MHPEAIIATLRRYSDTRDPCRCCRVNGPTPGPDSAIVLFLNANLCCGSGIVGPLQMNFLTGAIGAKVRRCSKTVVACAATTATGARLSMTSEEFASEIASGVLRSNNDAESQKEHTKDNHTNNASPHFHNLNPFHPSVCKQRRATTANGS